MALAVASAGTYADDFSGTSLAIGVPSGVTSGALVCVALIAYQGSTPTPPTVAGFTAGMSSPADLSAFGLSFRFYRFYKYATGADTGTYTVTKISSQLVGGFAYRVTGWTGSGNPFTDSLHEAANGSGPVSVAAFTPAGAGSLLEALALQDNTTPPSGWVLDAGATSRDGDKINLDHVVQTTAASTGTLTFGSGEGIASVATIRQASSGITGSGALTLPAITASGTGTRTVPAFTGTGTVTLPALTASGAGATVPPAFTGSGVLGLPGLSAAGTGTSTAPAFTGSGSLALPSMTAVGSGATTPPAFTGTGPLALPKLTAAGVGTTTPPNFDGSAALILPGLTATGSGTVLQPGSGGAGALTLPTITASGVGTVTAPNTTGTGALTLPAVTATGAGEFIPQGGGTGALTLPPLVMRGDGTVTVPDVAGTAALTLPTVRAAGVGVVTGGTTDRDITLTASPLPTRWATTPLADRWSTTPLPERWRAECLTP